MNGLQIKTAFIHTKHSAIVHSARSHEDGAALVFGPGAQQSYLMGKQARSLAMCLECFEKPFTPQCLGSRVKGSLEKIKPTLLLS